MQKPSHMEMAIRGLLSLLVTVCLARFADWPFGIVGFLSFLPVAAARATGTYHRIALHYFILAVSIFFLGGLGIAFFPIDNRVLTPVTLEMLPTIYAGVNPAGTDDRTVLFIGCIWHALLCASAIIIPIKKDESLPHILRAVGVFAPLIAIHLLFVRDRTPEEFTIEYRRQLQTDAVIAIFALMPVYAGFYAALFYGLVKEANKPAKFKEQSLSAS